MPTHIRPTYTKLSSPFVLRDSEEDEGGGDSSGGITIGVKEHSAYLRLCLLEKVRTEESKFGPVPDTQDPNVLLGKKADQNGLRCGGEKPHPHPLLVDSQQFSGVDPKLTPVPPDNLDARERFPALRLENQLRKNPSLGLGVKKSVTLSR